MKKTIFVRLLYVITVPAAALVALAAGALEPDASTPDAGTIQPGFDLLATVPLQTNAQASVAVNEALNKIYTSGGASSGQDVVVINGVTFATTDVGSGSGANGANGRLYLQASGVSKRVNPTTFAVTSNAFGTVRAINTLENRLYATSGN